MRRLLILLATSAALACGGSSSSNHNNSGPTGTIGGRAFTSVEARAVMATTTTPCSVSNPLGGGSIDIGINGMKLDIASYADVCGDYSSAQCKLHANGQAVTVIFAKLNSVPPYTPPTLVAGTYTVYSSPTTAIPDTSNPGQLTVAYAQALGSGAAPTCAGTPSPAVQGGTLRIDQVTGTQVTGAVSITFSDGSTVQGNFSAPTCPGVQFDICQIAGTGEFCSLPPTCS